MDVERFSELSEAKLANYTFADVTHDKLKPVDEYNTEYLTEGELTVSGASLSSSARSSIVEQLLGTRSVSPFATRKFTKTPPKITRANTFGLEATPPLMIRHQTLPHLFSSGDSGKRNLVRVQTLTDDLQKSKFCIPTENIEIHKDRCVGGGRFGKVFTATFNHATVAVKEIQDLKMYLAEGDLFFEASTHPNICRYFGFLTIMFDNFIVMEYFPDQSILKVLGNGHVFTFEKKIHMCKQIAHGVCHLHRRGVVHGDIACRNILVELRRHRVVLTDFGLSRKINDLKPSKTISPRWSSPELCRTRVFTCESDVYAYGVTCIELIHNGEQPFARFPTRVVAMKVMNEELRLEINKNWAPEMKDIFNNCFCAPDSRWSMGDISERWKEYLKTFERLAYE